MKGNDYSKLKAWYKLLMSHSREFIDLMERNRDGPKDIKMAFNVIKCGLFSHNSLVSEYCISFIV
jgi:hypothetical protein